MAKYISLLLYSAIAVVITLPNVGAQVHYMQFDATPLAVNPAFTGMFDGRVRASALYRNQWASVTVPYITYGTSFDVPVFIGQKNYYWALGTQIVRDVAGDGNIANFSGLFSVAYHRYFGNRKNHKSEIGIGAQALYLQRSIDLAGLFYGDAHWYGTTTWLGLGNEINYYKFSAGISFSQSLGRRFTYSVGLSENNVNEPSESVSKKSARRIGVDRNTAGILKACWIFRRLSIKPAIYVATNDDYFRFIVGNEFHYSIKSAGSQKRPAVFAGLWCRSSDVTVVTSGVEMFGVRFSLAYDYSLTSSNTSSNGNGGFEIAIKYVVPMVRAVGKPRM